MELESLVVICKRLFPEYFADFKPEEQTAFQRAIIKTLKLDSDSAFLRFLEQYENVSEFISDEANRIAAAKKAAKVTQEQITEALMLHQQKLSEIVNKIDTNLNAAIEEAKTALNENNNAGKIKIEAANAELIDLESKIRAVKNNISEINKSIAEEETGKRIIIGKAEENKKLSATFSESTSKVLASFLK